MRGLVLLLTSLLAPLAWASEADIRSDACRDTLAALQAHEAAMAAASAPPAAAASNRTWRTLRAKAARICLGGAPDAPPPPPRGATAPGIAVPPVAAPPTASAATPRTALPSLPARTAPPFVTLCDGAACWTSDGERLPQLGRSPFDARVHCAIQGRFVLCR